MTMFTIKTYTPMLSVVAWHGTTAHDLTPYILQVNTHKSLAEPVGQWSVLLTFEKPWHKILSTMDYVEIKMSRTGDLKFVMRGFITNRRRTKVIDRSGKIRRTITINGNDYGKLIQKYEIYYAANIPGQITSGSDFDPAQQLVDPLASTNLGAFVNQKDYTTPLSDLIPEIIKATVTPWIKSMQTYTPNIPLLRPLVNVLPDYKLSWITLQSMQGGLDGIINQYANIPWCEWFVFDAQDGPIIMHRNTPFKDKDGKYVFAESALGEVWWPAVKIIDEDIIEDDMGSSDSETYDYFFTYPSLFPEGDLAYKMSIITGGDMFGSGSNDSKLANEGDEDFPSNPKYNKEHVYRYGMQIMEQSSPAIPILDVGVESSAVQLSVKMNMWLVKAYGWAPDMLNGTIRLKGNPDITIGRYLFNQDSEEESYIESVDHVFGVSQIDSRGNDNTFYFETTVGVTRGRYASTPSSGSESESQLTRTNIGTVSASSPSTNSSDSSTSQLPLDYTDTTTDQSDRLRWRDPANNVTVSSDGSDGDPYSNDQSESTVDSFTNYLLQNKDGSVSSPNPLKK